jgi:hypothetical protein
MSRVAPLVPAEADILCEGCGYTLNGLPEPGKCPECGRPIASSLGHHRRPSPFELDSSPAAFWKTTSLVLTKPASFYATLTTRADHPRAITFAFRHRLMAAVFFGAAAWGHLLWVEATMSPAGSAARRGVLLLWGILLPPLVFALMSGITRLAAWLSFLEARYWGMRLPQPTVRRGFRYHAACYLPVGLLAISLVWGHLLLLWSGFLDHRSATYYLFTLCGAVIASAGYLFYMYWIAMKSMMYANR